MSTINTLQKKALSKAVRYYMVQKPEGDIFQVFRGFARESSFLALLGDFSGFCCFSEGGPKASIKECDAVLDLDPRADILQALVAYRYRDGYSFFFLVKGESFYSVIQEDFRYRDKVIHLFDSEKNAENFLQNIKDSSPEICVLSCEGIRGWNYSRIINKLPEFLEKKASFSDGFPVLPKWENEVSIEDYSKLVQEWSDNLFPPVWSRGVT